MRGNQLFGIFSPEKLKKVIPPHRAPGVQGGAQMRGNQLFGIFREIGNHYRANEGLLYGSIPPFPANNQLFHEYSMRHLRDGP